jgi:hypothetical protein
MPPKTTKQSLPNLFRVMDAGRADVAYNLLLGRLGILGRHQRMIEVCRQIRRFAAASGNKKAAYFTYSWERGVYNDLQDWASLWRVLRLQERAFYGCRLNLAKRNWKGKGFEILHFYGPVLYFRGEHLFGCRLWEKALREAASAKKNWSFDSLWRVYKPDAAPKSAYDVTLWHYYQTLGRDLKSWPLWDRFVDGFNPKLFSLSGVRRERLRRDPRLLEPFFSWIVETRERRTISGTSAGEQDLTESARKVRKRQTETLTNLRELSKRPIIAEWDETIVKLFPEIQDTPGIAELSKKLHG